MNRARIIVGIAAVIALALIGYVLLVEPETPSSVTRRLDAADPPAETARDMRVESAPAEQTAAAEAELAKRPAAEAPGAASAETPPAEAGPLFLLGLS